MDETIQENMGEAKQKLLENFDAEVHEKLRVNLLESKEYLDKYQYWLWETTKYFLGEHAEFADNEYSFYLRKNPFSGDNIPPGPYKIGNHIEDSHVYRPGHPLAQKILEKVKNKELPVSELVFDRLNNPVIINALNPLVGESGILRILNYTVQAFEKEDHIVITALYDNGEVIDPEIAKRMFSLSAKGQDCARLSESEIKKLEDEENKVLSTVSKQIAQRNGDFFDAEVDKLDKWAEDVKKALEIDLKKLDIDIKTAKTNAKKILNLDEKIKEQKNIKGMEKKRNEMRRRLFKSQDEVEDKKENLIDKVEAQLKQESLSKTLFTIRWKVI